MKDKKKLIIAVAAVVLVVILILVICLNGSKNKVKTVDVALGETVTVKNGEILRVNEDTTLEITSDLNFDKSAEDYEYEVAYILTVGEETFEGRTTFYPSYSVRSEAQNVPYQVVLSNFEKDSVKVVITQAQ